MKKGQALNNQRFERYFMAGIEIVDAIVVDTVGQFELIVKIDNELHRVNFALDGTMRSKERLEAHKECKIQKHDAADGTHALCKKLGVSVRLYQAMEFWMFRHWLRCRMREGMRRCEVGLCGKY